MKIKGRDFTINANFLKVVGVGGYLCAVVDELEVGQKRICGILENGIIKRYKIQRIMDKTPTKEQLK